MEEDCSRAGRRGPLGERVGGLLLADARQTSIRNPQPQRAASALADDRHKIPRQNRNIINHGSQAHSLLLYAPLFGFIWFAWLFKSALVPLPP